LLSTLKAGGLDHVLFDRNKQVNQYFISGCIGLSSDTDNELYLTFKKMLKNNN
jgi:hypothetical protein